MAVNKVDLFVFEIIDRVRKARTKELKLQILKENDIWAVKDVLGGIYSEKITWNLPEGAPPYRASEEHNAPSNLKRRNTDFRNFFKGGPGDKLPRHKREGLFIALLEAIHPEDAKLVIKMVNKEKIEGITKNVVMEAFPTLPIE
jgi:hypothetical protein|tara:strand:+ start:167 stop:598 length:432 start_codon:yes stop_codon:yes gene_type:complete